MDRLERILEESKAEILKRPNVVGVGIGYKTRGGRTTDALSIVAFVSKKLPLGELAESDVVPPRVGGVDTDVVEVGRIRPLSQPMPAPNPRQKTVPVQPGCSIGHYLVTAGTLGAIVRDNRSGAALLLSNNHVLANGSNGSDGRCAAGDPILQPGAYDGGEYPKDTVARLNRFVPLRPTANRVDAAVASPASGLALNNEIMGVGWIRKLAEALPGLPVIKFGRTTELTRGTVKAIHVSTNPIGYDGFSAAFEDQIFLSPMSAGGDSGALILTQANGAVGLLFAGSDAVTIANPMRYVLDELEVHIPI